MLMVALAGLVGAGFLLPTSPLAAAREAPISQNDAASGQDAGDSPANALLLTGAQRKWSANLTPPGSDTDWYRLGASGAFCAVGEATSTATGQLVLTSDPARTAATQTTAEPHRASRLVLAAPSGAPYLGLEPATMFSLVEGRARPSPGHYSFSLSAASYADLDPQRDGESPEAGSTPATAAPLADGCSAGRLGAGDVDDRYHLDVTDGAELTLSFAVASGDAASARVYSPTGVLVHTVASGGTANLWLDQPGRWSVVVSNDGGRALPAGLALALAPALASDVIETEYLLGVIGPPDPEPCRPSCQG